MRLLLRRARASVGLIGFVTFASVWTPIARWPIGRGVVAAAWRTLLWGFDIRVSLHGAVPRRPRTLYIANHLSWTDIAVLGAVLDCGFVAKSEVAQWPLIGPWARRYDCVFIARAARTEVADQTASLREQLERGASLILFAEGTTGLGPLPLPLRSSLLAVADVADQVVPIALDYRGADGSVLDPAARRRAVWIDDDELWPHVRALAQSGGLRVDVHFGAPVSAPDRKALARQVHAAITGLLEQAQAATENRTA